MESIGKRSIEEPKSTLLSEKLQGARTTKRCLSRRRRARNENETTTTTTAAAAKDQHYHHRFILTETYVNHYYIRENKTLAKTSRAMMMFWWCLYACDVCMVSIWWLLRAGKVTRAGKNNSSRKWTIRCTRSREREGEISWEMFPPKHLFSRGRDPCLWPARVSLPPSFHFARERDQALRR